MSEMKKGKSVMIKRLSELMEEKMEKKERIERIVREIEKKMVEEVW